MAKSSYDIERAGAKEFLPDKFGTKLEKGQLILYPRNFPGSQVSEIRVYEILEVDLVKWKLRVKERIGSNADDRNDGKHTMFTKQPYTWLSNYDYAMVVDDKLIENVTKNLKD